jgi:hypothetical protein
VLFLVSSGGLSSLFVVLLLRIKTPIPNEPIFVEKARVFALIFWMDGSGEKDRGQTVLNSDNRDSFVRESFFFYRLIHHFLLFLW